MNVIDLKNVRLETVIFEEAAELYCQVWKESPWNEDFWIASKVQEDMKKEFSKKSASAFFALDEKSGAVIGFSWGYEISKKEMRSISNGNILDDLFDDQEKCFYIDDLGVNSQYRAKGVGRKLSELLIGSAKRNGIGKIILRTDEKALSARNLYTKLGLRELSARDLKYPERTYWILDSL
jgi:ribosomal protein S18 acetylase RimI-like enzyme